MKNWLNSLESRERLLVIIGGSITLALLIYTLLWMPFAAEVNNLDNRVEAHRATLNWMKQNTDIIRSNNTSADTVQRGQSLIASIGQTTNSGPMKDSVKRVEESGSHSVRVWLEKAPFDHMVVWLEQMQKQFGAIVTSINIDQQKEPGQVNARLTLEQPE